MRTKKFQYKNRRKHRNKKSNKSKKCGCGVKIPFLKWGGDSIPNGEPDNWSKLKNFFSATKDNVTSGFEKFQSASTDSFKNIAASTKSAIDDTGNDITKNVDNVSTKSNNAFNDATKKTNSFFTNIYDSTKKSIHQLTTPQSTTSQSTTSQSTTSQSTTPLQSTASNGSNNSNYSINAIKKYKKIISSSTKGGRRRSTKKPRSRKQRRTKRRIRIYKHKGGSNCMNGPVGVDYSPLANNASPISDIRSVGPRPDQMLGQQPQSVWRFSN
jgi:hypothetical protein